MASITGRACILRAVVDGAITDNLNVFSVSHPGLGTYLITLIEPGTSSGPVDIDLDRADMSGWGEFTSPSEITVAIRQSSDNSLVDLPSGAKIQVSSYWSV